MQEGELIALTANTIVDQVKFRAEIDRVRRQGWAVDDCETAINLRCVALPVHDASGRVVAAISSSDDQSRMTPDRVIEVRVALQKAATAIAANLYRTGGPSPFNAPQRPAAPLGAWPANAAAVH
jgi:DNA-binding IclR family transcriptional regulator